MTESQFQTKFNRWKKYCWFKTAKFELKITKTARMSFNVLKSHQSQNLLNNKVIYKIPDCGNDQKPFDSFCIVGKCGYVVIMFYKRGIKHFYMFEIEEWLRMEQTSNEKSFSEASAKKWGTKCQLK